MPEETKTKEEVDVIHELQLAVITEKYKALKYTDEPKNVMLVNILILILRAQGASADSIDKLHKLCEVVYGCGVNDGIKLVISNLPKEPAPAPEMEEK